MGELITPAEYARRRKAAGKPGGTPEGVRRAIESGRIVLIDGRIAPEVADIQWEKNTRKRADLHGDAPESDPPLIRSLGQTSAWGDARARTELATAELKELELAQKKGELIDRAGYERAAYQTGRILQQALVDTFPSKVAVELAVLTDPWQVECFIRKAMRAELTAIAGMSPDEVQHASA